VLFRFEPAARIRARATGRRGRLRTFWSILFCLLLAILQLYTAVVDRDFAYFAFSVGMTFGTTDVEVTSSGFRHVMLPHKLISFAFNTAILALVFSVMFK
jgi:hypothetical protein